MKKSGFPTTSANPLALTPRPLSSPPLPKKLLLTLPIPSPSVPSPPPPIPPYPGPPAPPTELPSPSPLPASASPWIHPASSLNAPAKNPKTRIALRSPSTLRHRKAYTLLRPLAHGSGMRKINAVVYPASGSPKNSGPPAGCGVGDDGGSVSQDRVRRQAARRREKVVADCGSCDDV